MQATTHPPAHARVAEALHFLSLLGKAPDQTYFRTIPPGKGSNRSRRGADLLGFDPAALEADNKAGSAVYSVIGNATGATGVNKNTRTPTGAVQDSDCPTLPAVFVEWDDRQIDWQIQAWQELGLPEPSAIVLSGGKSVHAYWVLTEPMPADQWRVLQARLIKHCGSDSTCKNPSRVMRLPGFEYIDKKTGKGTGNYAQLLHSSTTRYSPEQIEACLPAPSEPPAAAPSPAPARPVQRGELPPRDLAQIEAAAQHIPRRVVGGNTYEPSRNALCGCSAALADAGHPDPDGRALELLADRWPDRATAAQVLGSARTRDAASFWAIAREHGYDLRRDRSTQGAQGDRQQRKPAGFTPRPATKVRWGKRELSHTRRMQCLERCVLVQAARERNSLRRRATLLRVARALGLHQIVNRQEIAQRVLEAKDQQQGNRYKALSAADRLAMPRPMVRFLLPGLLPANDLTILGGLAKVGKTRLAIAIVNAVLRGLAVLDMPAPTHTAPVVLVTDDQADGDTADMLQALDLWSHPGLTWSPNFRLTEADVDALLETIKANPGALVVLDSLRSISRNLQHGENDPEIGATLYDLKQAVIDSGGTVLLIHHCSKAAELVGVEALSGHNAIAGAANTVLTMHYLPGENGRPNKSSPERRLFREPRSGEGFDLVISRDGDSGGFRKVCSLSEWQQQAQEAKAASKRERLTPMQQQALEALQDADGDWLTRRQVVEALGLSWGDRGRNQDARRVEDALRRLVELQAAESQRAGTGATYRATCEAHRTTRTSVPTSGAKGSELSDENPDNPDNPDNQSPQGWPACPGVSGNRPDTENRCHNRLSGLSGLSDAPPAPPGTPKCDSAGDPWGVGSGADAYGDGDDPAWGPRREAA